MDNNEPAATGFASPLEHDRPIDFPVGSPEAEMRAYLVEQLGDRLTDYMLRQPTSNRLRSAHCVTEFLAAKAARAGGTMTPRSWWIRRNPQLGNQHPARWLRDANESGCREIEMTALLDFTIEPRSVEPRPAG